MKKTETTKKVIQLEMDLTEYLSLVDLVYAITNTPRTQQQANFVTDEDLSFAKRFLAVANI